MPVLDTLLLALPVGLICALLLGEKFVWRPSRVKLPTVADLLVVDDSAVARAKLRKLFVRSGYSVQVAGDGIEALALLDAGRYAMMVTDLEMPKMGGIELIHECRRRPHAARMPVIAVSAHENLRAKFNECRDICGVHRKPWVDDILLSHVATQIGTRNAVSPLDAERTLGAA